MYDRYLYLLQFFEVSEDDTFVVSREIGESRRDICQMLALILKMDERFSKISNVLELLEKVAK